MSLRLRSRLCRLMCGGGSAPPYELLNRGWGLRPVLWQSPKETISSFGRSETFHTSGGRAAKRIELVTAADNAGTSRLIGHPAPRGGCARRI